MSGKYDREMLPSDEVYDLLLKNVSRDEKLDRHEIEVLKEFRLTVDSDQWQRWLNFARKERKRRLLSPSVSRSMDIVPNIRGINLPRQNSSSEELQVLPLSLSTDDPSVVASEAPTPLIYERPTKSPVVESSVAPTLLSVREPEISSFIARVQEVGSRMESQTHVLPLATTEKPLAAEIDAAGPEPEPEPERESSEEVSPVFSHALSLHDQKEEDEVVFPKSQPVGALVTPSTVFIPPPPKSHSKLYSDPLEAYLDQQDPISHSMPPRRSSATQHSTSSAITQAQVVSTAEQDDEEYEDDFTTISAESSQPTPTHTAMTSILSAQASIQMLADILATNKPLQTSTPMKRDVEEPAMAKPNLLSSPSPSAAWFAAKSHQQHQQQQQQQEQQQQQISQDQGSKHPDSEKKSFEYRPRPSPASSSFFSINARPLSPSPTFNQSRSVAPSPQPFLSTSIHRASLPHESPISTKYRQEDNDDLRQPPARREDIRSEKGLSTANQEKFGGSVHMNTVHSVSTRESLDMPFHQQMPTVSSSGASDGVHEATPSSASAAAGATYRKMDMAESHLSREASMLPVAYPADDGVSLQKRSLSAHKRRPETHSHVTSAFKPNVSVPAHNVNPSANRTRGLNENTELGLPSRSLEQQMNSAPNSLRDSIRRNVIDDSHRRSNTTKSIVMDDSLQPTKLIVSPKADRKSPPHGSIHEANTAWNGVDNSRQQTTTTSKNQSKSSSYFFPDDMDEDMLLDNELSNNFNRLDLEPSDDREEEREWQQTRMQELEWQREQERLEALQREEQWQESMQDVLGDLRSSIDNAARGAQRMDALQSAARFLMESLKDSHDSRYPVTDQQRLILQEMLAAMEKSKLNFVNVENRSQQAMQRSLSPPPLPPSTHGRQSSANNPKYNPYDYSDNPHIPPPQLHDYFAQRQQFSRSGQTHPSAYPADYEDAFADRCASRSRDYDYDDQHSYVDDQQQYERQRQEDEELLRELRENGGSYPTPSNSQTIRSHRYEGASVRSYGSAPSAVATSPAHSLTSLRFQPKIGHSETHSFTQQLMSASRVQPKKNFYSNESVLTRLCIAQGPLLKGLEDFPLRIDLENNVVDVVWRESKLSFYSTPSQKFSRNGNGLNDSVEGIANRILRRERFFFDKVYYGNRAQELLANYIRSRTRQALQTLSSLCFLCVACGEHSSQIELEPPVALALGAGGGSGVASHMLREIFGFLDAFNDKETSIHAANNNAHVRKRDLFSGILNSASGGSSYAPNGNGNMSVYQAIKSNLSNRSTRVTMSAVLVSGKHIVDLLSSSASSNSNGDARQPAIHRKGRGTSAEDVCLVNVTLVELSSQMDFERIIGLLLGRRSGIAHSMQTLQNMRAHAMASTSQAASDRWKATQSSSKKKSTLNSSRKGKSSMLESHATWSNRSGIDAFKQAVQSTLKDDAMYDSDVQAIDEQLDDTVDSAFSSSLLLSFTVHVGSAIAKRATQLSFRLVCPTGENWHTPGFDFHVLQETIGSLPHVAPPHVFEASPLTMLLTDACSQPSQYVNIAAVSRQTDGGSLTSEENEALRVQALHSLRVCALPK